MEIQASLQCIHLNSPQPQALAGFYCNTYGMTLAQTGDDWVCSAPGRTVAISSGAANQLRYAQFDLHSPEAWAAFTARTLNLPNATVPARLSSGSALAFRDPDGNLMVFTPAAERSAGSSTAPSPAVLQHFAVRTTRVAEMLAFYRDQLGFVVSDEVRDETGTLRACFLRTDPLHHAMALFGAPAACFDHQSFETPGWDDMKRWGDHMAALKVPIVWGLGRHGPGNDVFFMVRDPDGNLAEISSEIESCAPDRPTGQWPHEERTLNLWGKAIMRD
ncbi:MAG: VOC family protein [Gammaproteobacteria bacterium]|nr:VOC family protein [Gammaproteobacteria bacterium]MBU0786991.1 VOC family protein [Gammaproteobacteria bacterium]MBU0816242.1 VOC family protein [Gammaproteobacteria bacterium]MBU1787879.1 VOC family protein [Gammaproteobacteria bacterium]